MIDGPKVLLKKVPGSEPIAKPAKYIPAIIFPQNIIMNILHNRFAKEIEKDEKKDKEDRELLINFNILILWRVFLFIFKKNFKKNKKKKELNIIKVKTNFWKKRKFIIINDRKINFKKR